MQFLILTTNVKHWARVPNSATLYTNFQRACTGGLPLQIFFNCYILVQRGSLHILRVSSHSYDKICKLSHPPITILQPMATTHIAYYSIAIILIAITVTIAHNPSTDQSNCQVTQVSTHIHDHHRQVSTYQSIIMCGPVKYSREELLKYNSTSAKLPQADWNLVKSLGLNAQKPTRRGTKRTVYQNKPNTTCSNMAVWNAQSMMNKTTIICDFIQSEHLDVLALTEAWFKGDA